MKTVVRGLYQKPLICFERVKKHDKFSIDQTTHPVYTHTPGTTVRELLIVACQNAKSSQQIIACIRTETLTSDVYFSLQPKLMAKDLLDLVASHFNLKEKEYFGIAYTDET